MWRRRRTRGAWLAPPLWLLWQLWLAPITTLSGVAAATPKRFCDKFNVPDTGDLHWARRSNELEAVKVSSTLILYCCAKHYDDILWFRIDESTNERVRLPDPLYASFDADAQDDDRALVSYSAQARDTGVFLCMARNNSEGAVRNITQEIRVRVRVYKPLKNKVTEDTYEELTQRIGDTIKIKCSIVSELPVFWFRIDGDKETFPDYSIDNEYLPNVNVTPIESFNVTNLKDVDKVNGVAITINPIKRENFGTYVCYWNKTKIIRTVILKEGDGSEELELTVICLVTLLIILSILGPLCWYWRVEIRLFWKDRFGKLEENDDKVYDIFVSYDADDAPFVLGTLVPVLEDHFRYRCFAWERDSLAGDWIPETLVQSVRDSRRFLMILSPAILENRWCTFALLVALKAVLQLQLHIICVKLHDVDWSQVQLGDKCANETVRQVLHVVRTVVWEPSKEKSRTLSNQQIATAKDKSLLSFNRLIKRKNNIPEEDIKAPGRSRFWRKLRLYLPPRRTLPLLSKPPASPTSTKSLLSLPHGPDCC